jgi:DUF4097 and DUF4098 domain-containing protein YvlB
MRQTPSARLPARTLFLAALVTLAAASEAAAQRFHFDLSFNAAPGSVVDISTMRGAIEVSGGSAGQVAIKGTVTVRIGFNVPVNAVELARRVAANPPVRQDGDTITLTHPTSDEEQRATTVSYRVSVPPGVEVRTSTDSGAIAITGVSARVTVNTQSGATDLTRLGGSAEVNGSSGAVRVDEVAGDLAVKTQSGAITLRGLGRGLRVRTQSGGVNARFVGREGQSDVETHSSGIDLVGIRGGLTAVSNNGHIRVAGVPSAPWDVMVGSSSIELFFDRATPLKLDATSGSGDVYLSGLRLDDAAIVKGSTTGTLSGGGPLVRASTRSGSVKVGLGR